MIAYRTQIQILRDGRMDNMTIEAVLEIIVKVHLKSSS